MTSRILLSAILVIGFTQCNKAPVDAASSSSGIKVVTEGASPHFDAVASHLEIGGASFSYSEEEGAMKMLTGLFEEILRGLPAEEAAKLPPGLSVRKIFTLIGLESVKASGSSSRTLASGANHNRSFAFTPLGRKGLLSLTGGPATPFLTREMAPQGADLAIEFPLRLTELAAEWPTILSMLPAEERPMVEAMSGQKMPPLGLSFLEMAQKTDLRLAIIATLNPDQPIAAPGSPLTFPGVDLAIVIDRLGWIKDSLKQQFMPMVMAPGGPIEATDADGIVSGKFRAPMMPAPMDFQPAFLLNEKADRLIIATRPAYLAALLVKENKLTSQPDFEAAWTGMPAEGNGCVFASGRFVQAYVDMMKQSVAMTAATDPAGAAMTGKVIDALAKYFHGPQASCWANLPDGILSVGNVSVPSINPSSISSVTAVAIVASLAVPAFTSIQKQGGKLKSANSGKQVLMGLKQYAASHDSKYPADLKALLSEGILDDETLLTFDGAPWLYDSTLTDTSPGISIVLAASAPGGTPAKPERLVVRNDGRVSFIPEEDFQRTKDYNLK